MDLGGAPGMGCRPLTLCSWFPVSGLGPEGPYAPAREETEIRYREWPWPPVSRPFAGRGTDSPSEGGQSLSRPSVPSGGGGPITASGRP
jgi:hypothetical protein